MEQHEEAYEQVIEVNNTNEGSKFISQNLVQEIVVQNDNNQQSNVNCETPGLEIMLPNDCINVQDQCNSNVVISCNEDGIGNEKQTENVIFKEESNKDESISQINNVEDVSSYNDSHKEDKIEFIVHDQTPYQENFEANNSVDLVTNKENISEIITNISESVPVIIENDPVSALTHNESINNHDDSLANSEKTESTNEIIDKNVQESDQELQNVSTNDTGAESLVSTIEREKIESTDVESISVVNEVTNDNAVIPTKEDLQTELANHCQKEEEKEGSSACISNININLPNEERDSEILHVSPEKVKDSEMVTETINDTKIVANSDDVAILTEFNSVEHNAPIEIPDEEERQNCTKSIAIDDKCEAKEEVKVETKEENQLTKGKRDDTGMELKVNEQVDDQVKEVKCSEASECQLVNENVEEEEEDEEELDLHLSTQSTENHSKVIQDIFDDWQDENGEDDNNQSSTIFKDNHDSVEMELQSLLDDGAQQEQTICSSNSTEHSINSNENCKNAEQSSDAVVGKAKALRSEKASPLSKNSDSKALSNKSQKSVTNYIPLKDHFLGRSPKNSNQDQSDLKQKVQSPRPGVKVPGLHLTSQIASTAEVNEVLKERLREKQKDLVVPKTADIVFVKKITQRLSSQLSAASGCNVPPLIPLQSVLGDNENDKDKSIEEALTESSKTVPVVAMASTDNKELLAILEGDVDPDWSNLKPQTMTEDGSNRVTSSGDFHNTGSKLDPIVERELALKQLLELPNISPKKNNSGMPKKTKKVTKSSSNRDSSNQLELRLANNSKTEIINLDSTEEDSPKKDNKATKALKENNNQNTRSSAASVIELSVEESRSGRKRKLTEKAREHELNVKRQKVYKGKLVPDGKRSSQESEDSGKSKTESGNTSSSGSNSPVPRTEVESSGPEVPKPGQSKPEARTRLGSETKQGRFESRQQSAATRAAVVKSKMAHVKRSKIGLLKKDTPISKRKLAVKNFLRQKSSGKKPLAAAKTKLQLAAATKSASQNKTVMEKLVTAAPVTKTKKIVTEIDRLLQDEGVVNLLYDVEQPDSRKRLIPITKSQKKVMDVEKAERELMLRTKLVRNAVLRLRNSSATNLKISPRSRRNVAAAPSPTDPPPPAAEKKSNEPIRLPKSSATPAVNADFIIPAKIRNAADASRIIRRHSSSSFSSASASPRVSIDLPSEQAKTDEAEIQIKTKRKPPQELNDKLDAKKTKKKEVIEKPVVKKEPVKKVTTRSNVVALVTTPPAVIAKAVQKNKKVPKSKASSDTSLNEAKTPPKTQDELSACLAEAASALLSSINNTSRSTNTSTNRKKGSTNNAKSQAADDEKVDIKKLFSNKEINVRQQGNLVQLILTPSTPVSGIRNAITIQVMNEIREALSILKTDDDCRVVLFTSTGTSFCEGLELSFLLHSNKEERKIRAEEMSNTVKEFIKALATFNKPIVAGVQGAAVGLGVTMLPLFDLVIASDKATFATPYGKLGQISEGAAVLTLSHCLGNAVTNELLLGGRTLTASEALRAGLVTRVLWPDRFQVELLPSVKTMSEQSSQSMVATKALLRHGLREKLDVALESESLLLIQHWCTLECQEAIKAYIDEKGQ